MPSPRRWVVACGPSWQRARSDSREFPRNPIRADRSCEGQEFRILPCRARILDQVSPCPTARGSCLRPTGSSNVPWPARASVNKSRLCVITRARALFGHDRPCIDGQPHGGSSPETTKARDSESVMDVSSVRGGPPRFSVVAGNPGNHPADGAPLISPCGAVSHPSISRDPDGQRTTGSIRKYPGRFKSSLSEGRGSQRARWPGSLQHIVRPT